jgi:outer membrane protein TolC
MQAQATADKAAATLDKVRLEAIRQIVHAQNDIETGYASYQAAQELSAAAQISHDAAMEAYRQGQGTLTAVTSAGNALLTAQIAVGDAYSTALASVVNLVFATGQLGAYSDIH